MTPDGKPSIEVDESRAPLLIGRFHGYFDDAEVEAWLDRVQALAERGPYGIAYLTPPRVTLVAPRHVRMQVQWNHRHHDLVARNCFGLAMVLPSPFMRGAARVVNELSSTPTVRFAARDEAEALAWLEQRRGEHWLRSGSHVAPI